MANARLSKEKQAMILAAICEGLPMNAVTRMFSVGKHAVSRVVEEAGEALSAYMAREFRDLPCERVAMDEQWQYVGKHGQRMMKKEVGRGDFWLWAAIDPDTKLLFSFRVGRRDWNTGEDFIRDASQRVSGPVQIATDPHRSYAMHIPAYFNQPGMSYGQRRRFATMPPSSGQSFTRLRGRTASRRSSPSSGRLLSDSPTSRL